MSEYWLSFIITSSIIVKLICFRTCLLGEECDISFSILIQSLDHHQAEKLVKEKISLTKNQTNVISSLSSGLARYAHYLKPKTQILKNIQLNWNELAANFFQIFWEIWISVSEHTFSKVGTLLKGSFLSSETYNCQKNKSCKKEK